MFLNVTAATSLPATDTYRAAGIVGLGQAGPPGQLADVYSRLDLLRPWALSLSTREAGTDSEQREEMINRGKSITVMHLVFPLNGL